jgi:hypothetical protein
MRMKAGVSCLAVCISSLVLAACGGGGGSGGSSHTYILTGAGAGSRIYVTIVSPVAIPASLLTSNGATIVDQAKGPQVCSFTKTAHGGHGQSAFLNGKTITLKINGSNALTSTICSLLKKAPFNAWKVGGG